jgi:hypothetical protein
MADVRWQMIVLRAFPVNYHLPSNNSFLSTRHIIYDYLTLHGLFVLLRRATCFTFSAKIIAFAGKSYKWLIIKAFHKK